MKPEMTKTRISGYLILLLLLGTGVGQSQDARQVLGKVAETYRSLKSYHFEGITVSETKTGGLDSTSEMPFEIAFAQPNLFRVEFRYSGGGNWLRVSDGKNCSRYRSLTRELIQKPVSPDDLSALAGSPIGEYERIAEGVKSAAIVGSETIRVEGREVGCYVIEMQRDTHSPLPGTLPLPTRLWVDWDRFIVLREVSGTRSTGNPVTQNTRTTTFALARINEPVPDALFVFHAEAGRK